MISNWWNKPLSDNNSRKTDWVDLYDKNIVDRIRDFDRENLREIIEKVGGFMKSQLDDDLSLAGLIEIIATNDNPSGEQRKVYEILGLKWAENRAGYSLEELGKIL